MEDVAVPQLIGCLAQGPGSALHLLAIVAFVLASRAIAKPLA